MFLTHSQRILLVSPCNTGKTTAVLKELDKRLGKEMQVYLFCPYIVQTSQNAQIILRKEDGYGIRPHEVTSAKGSTFVFDPDRPTVAVFDQIKKLLPSKNIFSDRNIECMMFLSRTVVVIDEVHLLKEQETFRGKTMRIIQEVLDLVVLYGGTGIYLTGTSRKVSGLPFDLTLHCHRIDSSGNRLPAINATKVDLLDWKGTTNHHSERKADMDVFFENSKASFRLDASVHTKLCAILRRDPFQRFLPFFLHDLGYPDPFVPLL